MIVIILNAQATKIKCCNYYCDQYFTDEDVKHFFFDKDNIEFDRIAIKYLWLKMTKILN